MGMIWGYMGTIEGLYRDYIGIILPVSLRRRVSNLSKHLRLDIQIPNHKNPNHGFIR